MKKNFYWRFSRKIEGEFWIFYKRFPWEKNWMEEIFKGISLKNWSWIHTHASLARAVFSFKTFFDCEWRSHLLSPTTSTSWTENERSEWLWSEKWSEWSEWVSEVKWSEVSEVKWVNPKRFFKSDESYICCSLGIYLNRYTRNPCTTIILWV